MLRTRVITALIGVAAFLLLIYLGGIWLALPVWGLAFLALLEYKHILQQRQIYASAIVMTIVMTLMIVGDLEPKRWFRKSARIKRLKVLSAVPFLQ